MAKKLLQNSSGHVTSRNCPPLPFPNGCENNADHAARNSSSRSLEKYLLTLLHREMGFFFAILRSIFVGNGIIALQYPPLFTIFSSKYEQLQWFQCSLNAIFVNQSLVYLVSKVGLLKLA